VKIRHDDGHYEKHVGAPSWTGSFRSKRPMRPRRTSKQDGPKGKVVVKLR
jgi:hypothetical protein